MKACWTFDKVIVARGINPDKEGNPSPISPFMGDIMLDNLTKQGRIEYTTFNGLLLDLVFKVGACSVVKGLRNGQDLEYERVQQYWSEDLGMLASTVYFICDRKLIHISSSAIRAVEKFNVKKN